MPVTSLRHGCISWKRRGRWQEYLYLAEAEGKTEAFVTMLVRAWTHSGSGRLRTRISGCKPGGAFALAKALAEHGDREQGVQMAEHGLTLEGSKAELAKWLRDQATALGNTTLALTAAEVALREDINLTNYLQVAEIAAEHWPRTPACLA